MDDTNIELPKLIFTPDPGVNCTQVRSVISDVSVTRGTVSKGKEKGFLVKTIKHDGTFETKTLFTEDGLIALQYCIGAILRNK